MNKNLVWLLAATWAVGACGGKAGEEGTGGASSTTTSSSSVGGGSGLPCDVDAVLGSTCRNCHGATPSYGAPMPLVTYADLQASAVTNPAKKVYELVKERVHDDAHPMPQAPYARLTTAELATIDTWVAGGATQSDATCEGAGGAGGGGTTGVSCTPDIHLAPSTPWVMPADQHDLYACYGVDIPAGSKKDIVAFVPHIDNPKIVHHVLLFQTNASLSSVPALCSGAVTGGQGKKLLYAWAPGGKAFELPPEAGMPIEGTSHYYVQVHYNNIQGLQGEKDSSGFDLCSTDVARANAADIVAFGTGKIDLPPAATTVADCSYTWPSAAGKVHAIAAFPHMHQLGTSIWTKKNPDTDNTDLGKNAPWNFNNQPFIPIDATISPGDVIETRCEWNNTTAKEVKAGEDTADEMCFSFTMYYPRAASFKSWLVPAALSQCK